MKVQKGWSPKKSLQTDRVDSEKRQEKYRTRFLHALIPSRVENGRLDSGGAHRLYE